MKQTALTDSKRVQSSSPNEGNILKEGKQGDLWHALIFFLQDK